MYALDLENSDAITLYVGDVERSRRFYQDLLGLSGEQEESQEAVLRGLTSESSDLQLRLRARTSQEEGSSSLWLSVEVDTVTDVLDLYLLAIILGSRAILPRKRGERWNTVVTDPDGHRVSIWTRVPRDLPGRDANVPTHARRSPRLQWEMAHRHGAGASEHRRDTDPQPTDDPAYVFGRDAGGADLGRMDTSAGRDTTPAN